MKNKNANLISRQPELLLQGLDSLYVAYYLEVADSGIDFDELAFRKERVGRSEFDDFEEMELGSERLALRPYGKFPYRYILANDQFEIRLAEHLKPACLVQFYSEGLWLFGLDALLARFADWCNSLKLLTSKAEVVSRADWAFDYHLPEIDFEPQHFLSRAKKSAVWHEYAEVQTISFGVGSTVIRVYDKAAEIRQQSQKAWFFQLWDRQDEVWRIEMQVRGPRLKRAGIRTIEDLKDCQNDLLRELAQDHTSLRKPNDDANRSRWPLHPLWRKLQKDIGRLPQTGLVRDIDAKQPLNWRLYQQGKSVYGMLKGMGVLMHGRGDLPEDFSLKHVVDRLPAVLKQHHREERWQRDVSKRIKAFRLGQW